MLCDCCKRLQNLNVLLEQEVIDHHDSLLSLSQAANDGCELCTSILAADSLRLNRRGKIAEAPSIYDGQAQALEGKTQITWSRRDSGWSIRQEAHPDSLQAFVELSTDECDPLSVKLDGRPVQEDARSNMCLKTIKTWISTCQRDHPQCRPPLQPLPTRVIDVGSSSKEPRLHISNPSEIASWVSLSHCWGGKFPLTTKLATLQKHCESIPMTSLPPVFRDAVVLTRTLGLRYLWIDSLCIIQDSRADWAFESTKMHNVYSGAVLCISASAANGSDQGIFASGNRSRSVSHPVVSIRCHTSIPCAISGTVCFRFYLRGVELWEEPLHTRAWVLQESTLSPRRIDFASTQLYWTCRESIVTESFPVHRNPLDTRTSPGAQILYAMPMALTPHPPFPTVTDVHGPDSPMVWWYGTLQQYITRGITNSGDLLPAIAGIALAIKERTGYKYVCGIWKEDFHRGLLWSYVKVASRRDDDPVPSWSWASLYASQNYMHLSLGAYEPGHRAEITSVVNETVGDLEFAPVVKAEIVVRGHCQNLASTTWKVGYTMGELGSTMHLVDCAVTNASLSYRVLIRLDEELVMISSYDDLVRREVLCMQIAMFSITKWKMKVVKEESVFGLLLEPTTKVVDAYRRIGMFEIPKRSGLADGWTERSVKIV